MHIVVQKSIVNKKETRRGHKAERNRRSFSLLQSSLGGCQVLFVFTKLFTHFACSLGTEQRCIRIFTQVQGTLPKQNRNFLRTFCLTVCTYFLEG